MVIKTQIARKEKKNDNSERSPSSANNVQSQRNGGEEAVVVQDTQHKMEKLRRFIMHVKVKMQ